ncbi:MAG: hypothetical protein HKN07_14095 [Acidimicrobiia bacterium]|nr:hypothetical protein [Acidimicrobiia bacterium]NNF65373.1 hypothetical protein [Acidimicrobiia bacterium]
MTWISDPHILLTVRGTTIPSDRGATIELHNQTAGSDEGVAAARALGDLSHSVFTPILDAPGAEKGEILFIDVWKNAEGLQTFFSNEQVQMGASMLFSEREAAIWMPAQGAFSFDLPPTTDRTTRYLGLARGPIADPAHAVSVFRNVMSDSLADARRRGQLSHQIYVSVPMSDTPEPMELLGIDIWSDLEGMGEHYASLTGFESAFSGEPQTSVWEQGAGGNWREW